MNVVNLVNIKVLRMWNFVFFYSEEKCSLVRTRTIHLICVLHSIGVINSCWCCSLDVWENVCQFTFNIYFFSWTQIFTIRTEFLVFIYSNMTLAYFRWFLKSATENKLRVKSCISRVLPGTFCEDLPYTPAYSRPICVCSVRLDTLAKARLISKPMAKESTVIVITPFKH